MASASEAAVKPMKKKGGGKKRGRGGATGYHDLCLELRRDATTVDQVQEMSRRLGELGYGCVAWNETVAGREGVRQLERKGGPHAKAMETLWLATQGPGAPPRQLRRVTVVVDDPAEAQFLSGALRGLRGAGAQLVAARPTSDRALTFLCESADVDIISLDVQGRAGFSLSAKQAETALRRGLVFEVRYAGALADASKRQQVLANITAIVAATRGRGLVWSSGSERADTLRGPHDVMNLAVVLGLKEDQALAALTSTCEAAIGHAEARCLEWIPVQIVKQPQAPPQASSALQATAAAQEGEEGGAAGPAATAMDVGAGGSVAAKKKKKKKKGKKPGDGAGAAMDVGAS